ncbi:hypothetical protein VTG60DRAFT_3985 [Thermothelomyces hinnuleus]
MAQAAAEGGGIAACHGRPRKTQLRQQKRSRSAHRPARKQKVEKSGPVLLACGSGRNTLATYQRPGRPLHAGTSVVDTTHTHTRIYIYTSIYIYIDMYAYLLTHIYVHQVRGGWGSTSVYREGRIVWDWACYGLCCIGATGGGRLRVWGTDLARTRHACAVP